MQFKICAKCGESHPRSRFTYLATYAQSKAWGRAGNVRMQVESKLCSDCRPKRKPKTKLSAKEIHNKVQSGDLNSFVALNLREKQAQKERNAQAKAARYRWVKQWKAELKTALAPITKEIISARNTYKYAKEKGYVDKAEFYFKYHGLLHHEKTHAELSYMTNPRRPASSRWADYVGDAVFAQVREMWAALPPVYKHSRTPLLIKHRPD